MGSPDGERDGAAMATVRRMVVLLALLGLCAAAAASAEDDIGRHRSCMRCGMDRKAFGYSRMLVQYADGAEVGVCSLHCAAEEVAATSGSAVKSLRVADRDTRELVDAERAVWVMGGDKRGVMTQRPKWAFRERAAAEAFVKAHGGEIVSWAEALKAARSELK